MSETANDVSIDTDQLPPTQNLIMEVLAARHRLGETWWPFGTNVRAALKALESAGLVSTTHGNVERTIRARLTDNGKRAALDSSYQQPSLPMRRCGGLTAHAEHLYSREDVKLYCPGVEHNHDQRCCSLHSTHTTPHKGCIMR